MLKIGVTGTNGFIAKHLIKSIEFTEKFKIIPFNRSFFQDDKLLDSFISNCNVVIHLAGLNRSSDPNLIFKTNIDLANSLLKSISRTNFCSHLIFASSSQEDEDNLYGKSKKIVRELFFQFSLKNKLCYTGLVIPNVFGPFGMPFYNSVITTFCYQLTNNISPKIDLDKNLNLIYISDLVLFIIRCIDKSENSPKLIVKHSISVKVSDILKKLENFKLKYFINGQIPELITKYDLDLFNTFRSHISYSSFFPIKYKQNNDIRGSFVELIKTDIGGQMSFSTTLPNVTRGNHFHTRKIERFSVIHGKALVQIRSIFDEKVIEFYLDGNNPSYIDMPVWYTHNIKNIGDNVLFTNFWINEPFNEDDPDTFFINV